MGAQGELKSHHRWAPMNDMQSPCKPLCGQKGTSQQLVGHLERQ